MSQIKLLTASSGSIALEPTNTASNLVITVPAVTGTMATVDGSGNASVTGNLSFNSGYGSSAVAYGCRAWVNFNGTGTVAIRASGNVSSITDNGTGDYTVNFSTAMPDANYSAVITVGNDSSSTGQGLFATKLDTLSSSSVRFKVGRPDNGVLSDSLLSSVAIFR
jgi:uncharacterized protein (AIM24 family)